MKATKFFHFSCLVILMVLCSLQTSAAGKELPDTLCTHDLILNAKNQVVPWYKPDVEGAAYAHVVKLASEFLRDILPEDEKTGLKQYYLLLSI